MNIDAVGVISSASTRSSQLTIYNQQQSNIYTCVPVCTEHCHRHMCTSVYTTLCHHNLQPATIQQTHVYQCVHNTVIDTRVYQCVHSTVIDTCVYQCVHSTLSSQSTTSNNPTDTCIPVCTPVSYTHLTLPTIYSV